MSIRVPVKYRFDASLDRVLEAYQQKMLSRSHERTKGVSVRVRETSPSQSTYAVTRSMPTWYRLLGGKDSTQYVETLKLEDGKMITSASQNLPFGGKAETRIVFVPDGTSTVVIGTVTASQLPNRVQRIAQRVFKSYVEKTFAEERKFESKLILA